MDISGELPKRFTKRSCIDRGSCPEWGCGEDTGNPDTEGSAWSSARGPEGNGTIRADGEWSCGKRIDGRPSKKSRKRGPPVDLHQDGKTNWCRLNEEAGQCVAPVMGLVPCNLWQLRSSNAAAILIGTFPSRFHVLIWMCILQIHTGHQHCSKGFGRKLYNTIIP